MFFEAHRFELDSRANVDVSAFAWDSKYGDLLENNGRVSSDVELEKLCCGINVEGVVVAAGSCWSEGVFFFSAECEGEVSITFDLDSFDFGVTCER